MSQCLNFSCRQQEAWIHNYTLPLLVLYPSVISEVQTSLDTVNSNSFLYRCLHLLFAHFRLQDWYEVNIFRWRIIDATLNAKAIETFSCLIRISNAQSPHVELKY